MNTYLSNKLKVISFISIILVIYIHSYNLKVNFQSTTFTSSYGFNSFIQNLISQGIARSAVPLFFIISGFLFFLNTEDNHWSKIKKKIISRFRSLLIPFLLWSTIGLLFLFTMQSIPILQDFFANKLIRDYTFFEFLDKLLIQPVPYQFWFLRDLFLIVLLSPLIYWVIKNTKYLTILLITPLWLMNKQLPFFEFQSLYFFMIGGFYAIWNKRFLSIGLLFSKKSIIVLTIIWLLCLIIKTQLINQEPYLSKVVITTFHKVNIIIGIIVFWNIYDYIKLPPLLSSKLLIICQYTFFLFAIHEPTLTILIKISHFILGHSEWVSIISYLILPFITMAIGLFLAKTLKNTIPNFYKLATGGR